MRDQLSELVYSTDPNWKPPAEETQLAGDGVVRIKRETKGRKGKGVTAIYGIRETEEQLKTIAKQLKKKTGTGGSLKDGVIIIQGDCRQVAKTELEKLGYTVKLAGG